MIRNGFCPCVPRLVAGRVGGNGASANLTPGGYSGRMACFALSLVSSCGAVDDDGARSALFLVVKEDNGVPSVNGVDDGCYALHGLCITISLG